MPRQQRAQGSSRRSAGAGVVIGPRSDGGEEVKRGGVDGSTPKGESATLAPSDRPPAIPRAIAEQLPSRGPAAFVGSRADVNTSKREWEASCRRTEACRRRNRWGRLGQRSFIAAIVTKAATTPGIGHSQPRSAVELIQLGPRLRAQDPESGCSGTRGRPADDDPIRHVNLSSLAVARGQCAGVRILDRQFSMSAGSSAQASPRRHRVEQKTWSASILAAGAIWAMGVGAACHE
jgi:hypothetical protein